MADSVDLTATGLQSSSPSGDEYAKRVRYGGTTGPRDLAQALSAGPLARVHQSVQAKYGSGDE